MNIPNTSFVDMFGMNAEKESKALDEFWNNLYFIYYDATKFHFEDRIEKNGKHPTYEQVIAPNSGWTLLKPSESIYHDDKKGKAELKFVHDDGREAVFNGDTLMPMIEAEYMATYNYGVYKSLSHSPSIKEVINYGSGAIKHLVMDVAPYYLTIKSNTREQFEDKVSPIVKVVVYTVDTAYEMIDGILEEVENFLIFWD